MVRHLGRSEISMTAKALPILWKRKAYLQSSIMSILQDKNGNFWFGTFGGGVTKYDWQNFTHFTDKEGLSNNSVLSIMEDESGNLWIGTLGGGVNKYDGNSFTYFTEKEGLSNNFVLSTLEDSSGNLWFGTQFGLSQITKEKLSAFNKIKTGNTELLPYLTISFLKTIPMKMVFWV